MHYALCRSYRRKKKKGRKKAIGSESESEREERLLHVLKAASPAPPSQDEMFLKSSFLPWKDCPLSRRNMNNIKFINSFMWC